MNESLAIPYLQDALASFRAHKKLAEKALAQITDEEFFASLDAESNSIAVIMKHMAGNMLSRWTDFLSSDGEKPDRNRDSEFVIEPQTTKAELLGYWEKGWDCVFRALEALQPDDFAKKSIDSRRGTYNCAGNQSSVDALRVSRRSDCFSGKTFSVE